MIVFICSVFREYWFIISLTEFFWSCWLMYRSFIFSSFCLCSSINFFGSTHPFWSPYLGLGAYIQWIEFHGQLHVFLCEQRLNFVFEDHIPVRLYCFEILNTLFVEVEQGSNGFHSHVLLLDLHFQVQQLLRKVIPQLKLRVVEVCLLVLRGRTRRSNGLPLSSVWLRALQIGI